MAKINYPFHLLKKKDWKQGAEFGLDNAKKILNSRALYQMGYRKYLLDVIAQI